MNHHNLDLLIEIQSALAVCLAWPDNAKLRSKLRVAIASAQDGRDQLGELRQAAGIARTTLETVYHERDPKNIAAKCAAERLAKLLP